MAVVESNPNLGAQIVEDAKEYVLYSWSTQDAINPIAVAGAEGQVLLGLRGKALSGLRLAARERQHRPPAPEDHRGDQGAGRPALHDRAADGLGVALAARQAARRGHAWRSLHVLLHELGRGGERERDQARATRDRTPQDRRTLPLVPRSDARFDHPHGRSAQMAERAGHGRRRPDARPLHVPLPRRSSGSLPCAARVRRTSRRSSSTRARTRSRRSSSKRSPGRTGSSRRRRATCRRSARSATGTGSCSSSTRSWPASDVPGAGSPARTGTSSRTSSPSPRASTRATSRSAR